MISEEKLGEIQQELEGTCLSLTAIVERHELTISEDELEDELLNQPQPVERCCGCEWWFDVSVLTFDEERGGGLCDQCVDED